MSNVLNLPCESCPDGEGKHLQWSGTKLCCFHRLPDSEICTSEYNFSKNALQAGPVDDFGRGQDQ